MAAIQLLNRAYPRLFPWAATRSQCSDQTPPIDRGGREGGREGGGEGGEREGSEGGREGGRQPIM